MIAAQEAKVLKEQKVLLEERIDNLKQQITALEEKDSEKTALFNNQLANLLEQKAIYTDQINTYEKLLRKERRKRFWTGAAGVVTTGVATYLLITK